MDQTAHRREYKSWTRSAQQLEAGKVLADLEGNPDELEEDLTQVISITFVIFKLFLLFLLFLLTTSILALFLLLSYLLLAVLSAVFFVIFNT